MADAGSSPTRTAARHARRPPSISAFTSALIFAASSAASSLIIATKKHIRHIKHKPGYFRDTMCIFVCALVPVCGPIIIRDMTFVRLILFFTVVCVGVMAQSPDPIVAAVETENWQTARTEINKVRTANEALFREKNYDYLLGRIAERTGDTATALTSYQAIAANNSKLREYALWRLAR